MKSAPTPPVGCDRSHVQPKNAGLHFGCQFLPVSVSRIACMPCKWWHVTLKFSMCRTPGSHKLQVSVPIYPDLHLFGGGHDQIFPNLSNLRNLFSWPYLSTILQPKHRIHEALEFLGKASLQQYGRITAAAGIRIRITICASDEDAHQWLEAAALKAASGGKYPKITWQNLTKAFWAFLGSAVLTDEKLKRFLRLVRETCDDFTFNKSAI